MFEGSFAFDCHVSELRQVVMLPACKLTYLASGHAISISDFVRLKGSSPLPISTVHVSIVSCPTNIIVAGSKSLFVCSFSHHILLFFVHGGWMDSCFEVSCSIVTVTLIACLPNDLKVKLFLRHLFPESTFSCL